ncbi:hypothetical protein LJR219_002235 [Phenylobacterium sp. LjRoot219]|uniref:bile acid:sodium symporter family protein n=1 Tax=Phenylobacterium sp. LjRoot219 TaxID=3342283 RepID=UPI003ECD29E2
MAALSPLYLLLLLLSVGGIVVAVGMDADRDDLLYLFRRPVELAKAVLAVNVIVPIAAVLLVFLFPLTAIAKTGIVLMAVSPVPPLVPRKELKVGAGKSYAYGVYVTLGLLAVVMVPLVVAILDRVFTVQVAVPMPRLVFSIVLMVLLPLVIGLAIRRFKPVFAEHASPLLSKLSMVLLVLVAIPLAIHAWPSILALVGNGTIVAMALTALVALAGGHLLGGPLLENRAALAVTCATRHPGIALMIANANHLDKQVTAAILCMLLVGLIVSLPYQFWIKRQAAAAVATTGGVRR